MSKKKGKKRPQRSRKGKRGRPSVSGWTPKRRQFCDGLAQGMTQTEAARYAGYSNAPAEGVKLMKLPFIIRWRARYEKMRRKAAQDALNADALKHVTSRRNLEEKLVDLLLNGETEGARVNAGLALAGLNGSLADCTRNRSSLVKAKSELELAFMALHEREPADAAELEAFAEIHRAAAAAGERRFAQAKQENAAKIQAMVADPLIWMQQHTKTKDSHWREHGASGPYRPFPDKPYFRPIVEDFQTEPILFIEKSRDMMISWLITGLFTHTVMTTEGIEVIFQSQKAEKAAELIDYAKCLYEHQPPELQAAFPLATKLSRQPRMELRFAHGGRLLGIPGGADQIRSYHPWGLFADEAAFQPEAGECYEHAVPVCQKIVEVSSIGPGWFSDVVTDNI